MHELEKIYIRLISYTEIYEVVKSKLRKIVKQNGITLIKII